MSLFRTKQIAPDVHDTASSLHRCLTAFDLTLLGIGAIIGAGVFVLTGVAAATKAGPAISLSYVIAGLTALCAALSYAELATSVGGSGSAYTYTYSSFGELVAWLVGWALVLEYAMAVSSVAVGWSSYVSNVLQALNIPFPEAFLKSPLEGGNFDLPAISIILFLTGLLCIGVKHSATFNSIIVVIKLITIAIFITVASMHVNPHNWDVFFPFGINGVAKGAAIVFFAYVGFDAVSTAAEETINPQRNLPIGIILSLIICTIVYVIVSALLTGITHYSTLNVDSPVSDALLTIGHPIAAGIIGAGAIAGLTTVMLVMFYGLTRILYAISRDGLLPKVFSKINPRSKTPIPVIITIGIIIALLAGFTPLRTIAELVNIGTLTAFMFVCASVIYLRWKQPNLARPFRLPWNPFIPAVGIVFCLYLMLNLPAVTWWRFLTWMGFGLIIYFGYSRRHSLLR